MASVERDDLSVAIVICSGVEPAIRFSILYFVHRDPQAPMVAPTPNQSVLFGTGYFLSFFVRSTEAAARDPAWRDRTLTIGEVKAEKAAREVLCIISVAIAVESISDSSFSSSSSDLEMLLAASLINGRVSSRSDLIESSR